MVADRAWRRWTGHAAAYLVLAALSAFALAPLAWLALTSVRPQAGTASGWTLQHFSALWLRSDVGRLFGNSLVVLAMALPVTLLAAIPAAYAVARLGFRGRSLVWHGAVLSRMVPPVTLLVPLFVAMSHAGLVDTRSGLAVVEAGLVLPATIILMRSFFEAVPAELEEAALIDGCSRLGTVLRIALPLTRAGIGVSAVAAAIIVWNELLLALMLTSSAASRTWPVGLRLMVGEFQLPVGELAAGGMLGLLPMLLLFALVHRGLVAAGLKAPLS
jgi:multiple sugar transport system permease protein